MGLLKRMQSRVKKYWAEREEREKKRLDKAKTWLERDREKAKIVKERLAIKRELAEAQASVSRAEAARKRADKEAKDAGDSLLSGLSRLFKSGKITKRRGKATSRKKVKAGKTRKIRCTRK